jgi:hypothetical protein
MDKEGKSSLPGGAKNLPNDVPIKKILLGKLNQWRGPVRTPLGWAIGKATIEKGQLTPLKEVKKDLQGYGLLLLISKEQTKLSQYLNNKYYKQTLCEPKWTSINCSNRSKISPIPSLKPLKK